MPTCAGRAVAPLEAHQAAKSRQSRGVGRPGRQRLLRLGVGHGGVDLGRGQGAGQRRAEGDQVVQGGSPDGSGKDSYRAYLCMQRYWYTRWI